MGDALPASGLSGSVRGKGGAGALGGESSTERTGTQPRVAHALSSSIVLCRANRHSNGISGANQSGNPNFVLQNLGLWPNMQDGAGWLLRALMMRLVYNI